ncbi:MAG: DUF3859 domain-containing protein [Alphaproteobacteria bacterium]|nr:DUF3859 domain-containing protein [Alphaproteobacteria bacterium]MCW5744301.1 DUF3859 domain-containing protein [Alphaproteobacteria bacterium]
MGIRRWSLGALAALALFAVGGASGQQGRLDRIEIIQSGLYSASIVRRDSAHGTPTGQASLLDSPSFYADAARVPAQIGIRFGFQYRLIGSPPGREVALRGVWQIPAPGITNPVNGNTYRESARDFTARIGDTQIHGYGFDQPWEIVAGNWVLEIWHEKRLLASRTFLVEAP